MAESLFLLHQSAKLTSGAQNAIHAEYLSSAMRGQIRYYLLEK